MKVYLVAYDAPEGVMYWVHDNQWTIDAANGAWTDDKEMAQRDADQWCDYWAVKGYGKSAYVAEFFAGELEV